jgi:hypothetical protein
VFGRWSLVACRCWLLLAAAVALLVGFRIYQFLLNLIKYSIYHFL